MENTSVSKNSVRTVLEDQIPPALNNTPQLSPAVRLLTAGQLDNWTGYPLPLSNTTYVPNQFFDVVLPNSSRGCVRLVGYMIRKILGWCDSQGNPLEQTISVTHRELATRANISRRALPEAIQEALSKRYINCLQQPQAKALGTSATTGQYELRFDRQSPYTRNLAHFNGFFAGNGNRTYIPNAFFDFTIRAENLALAKTVGAIARNTIGYQNEFGFRRQEVRLSYRELERITGLSRRHLNSALDEAIDKNHIVKLDPGVFDPNAGHLSKATLYGLKWAGNSDQITIGAKRIPAHLTPVSGFDQSERGKKDTRPETMGAKRIPDYRGKKETGIGAKRTPEERGKKETDINKSTKSNQQSSFQTETRVPPAPVRARPAAGLVDNGFDRIQATEQIEVGSRVKREELIMAKPKDKPQGKMSGLSGHAAAAFIVLVREGFDKAAAKQLAEKYPLEQIRRQCELMAKRTVTKSRLGMLRKSIEQDWPDPEAAAKANTEQPRQTGAKTARTIYRPEHSPTRSSEPTDQKTAAAKLARLQRELQLRWPERLESFHKQESKQRLEIERMPMVGQTTIDALLKTFDDPGRRLERLRNFSAKLN